MGLGGSLKPRCLHWKHQKVPVDFAMSIVNATSCLESTKRKRQTAEEVQLPSELSYCLVLDRWGKSGYGYLLS